MQYFTPAFVTFFKELGANNNKEWFDANRKRYEKEVKKPFERFVGDLIAEMRKNEPELLCEPKDCIFRINRDIRFSKDKTPYKVQVSALIAPRGRKHMDYPGLYLELTPEHIGIFGGLYMPDKSLLADVRDHIADHLEAFKKAYSDPQFLKFYGGLKGEKNKRLDKHLAAAAEVEPLLFNKQFYYQANLPATQITQEALLQNVLKYYEASAQIREFLRDATGQNI